MRKLIWNEAQERWIAPIEAMVKAHHDIFVEGFLDVGPVRIARQGFVLRQERNAFDLGRDYGRYEAGMRPAPLPPEPRRLRAV